MNEPTDKKGKMHESFPRERQHAMIATAKLPDGAACSVREARPNDIQHNKFMVLLKGASREARRGVDRLDQHLDRRHPRPDQRRPLGA